MSVQPSGCAGRSSRWLACLFLPGEDTEHSPALPVLHIPLTVPGCSRCGSRGRARGLSIRQLGAISPAPRRNAVSHRQHAATPGIAPAHETGRGRVRSNTGVSARCAGVEDFRWHDLRHTWASWHARNGTPLYALQETGGWQTPAMVRRYAHLAPAHLAPRAEAVSAQVLDTLTAQGQQKAPGA